jgi:C-terminal processing protease CtpA/Prc
MKEFCHFLIHQWDNGNIFSDPTYLFGVDEIRPHPRYRYNKPIVLLINSLDFSGGDFFPAILQDNKRAVVLGTRTAGAGGYVLTTEYPNHSGIKHFIMTGSLAKRIDQKPIENLGVTPDIHYELTPDDVQGDYKEYVSAILDAVEKIAPKASKS